MPENNYHHLEKEKFQLDRVALFSDAVFAISITLLVIDIQVPELHVHPNSDRELLNELMNMGLNSLAFSSASLSSAYIGFPITGCLSMFRASTSNCYG